MVKWFPDRRGLATGVVAAGYGFGAILTTFPIDGMLKASGYQHTLVHLRLAVRRRGCGRARWRCGRRATGEVGGCRPGSASAARSATPAEMLQSPVFWLMFVMMSMMSTGGLMVITQFTSFAKAFGIDGTTSVTILGATMAAIPAALTFDRITNGLTRPFFGLVSDHIGRENTMGIAFILEGFAIYMMLQYRTDPFLLIVLSGLVFFGWGEIFSLFPSTLTDTFGPAARHHQLRLPLHGAGRRLDPGRPGRRHGVREDRQLDAGVRPGDRNGCAHRAVGAVRAQADAAAAAGGGG